MSSQAVLNRTFGQACVTASSGNVAAGVAAATLPAAAGVKTYITGFDVKGAGATAASVVQVTVANAGSGTLTYALAVPAGVTTAHPGLSIQFDPPLPANALNTTIVVSCPSLGAGNTSNTVNAYGFQINA